MIAVGVPRRGQERASRHAASSQALNSHARLTPPRHGEAVVRREGMTRRVDPAPPATRMIRVAAALALGLQSYAVTFSSEFMSSGGGHESPLLCKK
jgi:hypothetical protein